MNIPHEYFLFAYTFIGGGVVGAVIGFCLAVYAAAGLPGAAADILNSTPKGK